MRLGDVIPLKYALPIIIIPTLAVGAVGAITYHYLGKGYGAATSRPAYRSIHIAIMVPEVIEEKSHQPPTLPGHVTPTEEPVRKAPTPSLEKTAQETAPLYGSTNGTQPEPPSEKSSLENFTSEPPPKTTGSLDTLLPEQQQTTPPDPIRVETKDLYVGGRLVKENGILNYIDPTNNVILIASWVCSNGTGDTYLVQERKCLPGGSILSFLCSPKLTGMAEVEILYGETPSYQSILEAMEKAEEESKARAEANKAKEEGKSLGKKIRSFFF